MTGSRVCSSTCFFEAECVSFSNGSTAVKWFERDLSSDIVSDTFILTVNASHVLLMHIANETNTAYRSTGERLDKYNSIVFTEHAPIMPHERSKHVVQAILYGAPSAKSVALGLGAIRKQFKKLEN